MPSSYTLYTPAGSFRAFSILIAAEYSNISITINTDTNKGALVSPTHKLPVLTNDDDETLLLFGSHSIARYVASDSILLGNTTSQVVEQAHVNGWIEFCSTQVELPACVWFYPAAGYMPFHKEAYNKAKKDLAVALSILEKQLSQNKNYHYLVGESVTLADITICSTLVYPFQLVCDEHYLSDYPNVVKWFQSCVGLPEFKKILGDVQMCQQETLVGAAGQKLSATSSKKTSDKDKKDTSKMDAAPVAPAPKKTEHIYKIMDRENPSDFRLDAWKKTYSNATSLNDSLMNDFWKTFDAQNWSLWHQQYNHNDENKRVFMCSNKITGFFQRTDSIRRWAFGVMTVTGDEQQAGGLIISGVWLLRGDSVEAMLQANDDANWYTWTKLAGKDLEPTDEVKATVAAYWCDENEIEGKPVQDSKVFK